MSKNYKKDSENLESIMKAVETGDITLDEAVDKMKKASFTL